MAFLAFCPAERAPAIGISHKEHEDNWGFIEVWDVRERKVVVKAGTAEGSKSFGSVLQIGFGKDY